MIVPPDVDLATVGRADLIAAYLRTGFSREDSELYADLILDPDRDVPLI